MRLFNLDLHISVIADFRDVFAELRPDVEIVDWSLSSHTWVFDRQPARPEVIHQESWMGLSHEQIAQFQRRYDDFLYTFDGFLVGHVMPYVMLFEKYGKPIFAWNTCRYDLPFCFTKDRHMLADYHACLHRLKAAGRLRGFSNNKADQAYLRLGSGLDLPRLPSLGRYTGMRHAPTTPTFYWYSGTHLAPASPHITVRRGRFTWPELAAYRGIIHVPYESSTMSLCEQYSAGIPLFLPTARLLKEWWLAGRNTLQGMSAYWGREAPAALGPCQSPDFWIQHADYYDTENMRYLYYFDSLDELLAMLAGFEDRHRQARLAWLEQRCRRVLASWDKLVPRGA